LLRIGSTLHISTKSQDSLQDCDFDDIHERGLEYVFDFVKARIRQRKSHTRDTILGLASHQLAKGTGPGRALLYDNVWDGYRHLRFNL